MKTKRCSKCKKVKPLDKFHRQTANIDGRHYWCKQCVNEYMRQRYADNPEYSHQYRAEHREKARKYAAQRYADKYANDPDYRRRYRQYYIDHREESKESRREYRKQYYATHQEEIRKHKREYYINHREEIIKRTRQYRIDHLEKSVVYVQRRRARKAEAEGSYTAEQFIELCERYDNRCLCCGKTTKLTVDHIVPLSKGGSNNISNIQPLCKSCNSKKHTQTIDYRPDIVE